MGERGDRSPRIMSTPKFGEAVETYKGLLTSCGVRPEDIQRQISKISDPATPRKKAEGFIGLTQTLQAIPQPIHKRPL
jgi:hypothetical protein